MGIAGRKDDVDDAIHVSHGDTVRHERPDKVFTTSRAPADPKSLIGKRGPGKRQAEGAVKRSQHLAGEDAWKTQEPTPRQKPQDTEKKKGSFGSLSNASQRSSDYRPRIRARRGDTMDTTMMPRDCYARECAW
jgi:hypothetical protein